MIKPPLFIGKLIYFFGYPVLWAILHDSTRAYVLVKVKNEVLLTKNLLGFHKTWRLPGGGVKLDENPKIAALRELAEEVGITAKLSQVKLLQDKPFHNTAFGYDYYVYLLVLPKKPIVTLDNQEIADAAFVNVKSSEAPKLSEEVQNAINLVKLR